MSENRAVTIVAEEHTKHLDRIATALEELCFHKKVDQSDPKPEKETVAQDQYVSSVEQRKELPEVLKVGWRVYTLHTEEIGKEWRGLNGKIREIDEKRGEARVELDNGLKALVPLTALIRSGSTYG